MGSAQTRHHELAPCAARLAYRRPDRDDERHLPRHTYGVFGTPRLVRVARSDGTYLNLEFRQPWGIFDNSAGDPVVNGVPHPIAPATTSIVQSKFVDATPGNAQTPTRHLLLRPDGGGSDHRSLDHDGIGRAERRLGLDPDARWRRQAAAGQARHRSPRRRPRPCSSAGPQRATTSVSPATASTVARPRSPRSPAFRTSTRPSPPTTPCNWSRA